MHKAAISLLALMALAGCVKEAKPDPIDTERINFKMLVGFALDHRDDSGMDKSLIASANYLIQQAGLYRVCDTQGKKCWLQRSGKEFKITLKDELVVLTHNDGTAIYADVNRAADVIYN